MKLTQSKAFSTKKERIMMMQKDTYRFCYPSGMDANMRSSENGCSAAQRKISSITSLRSVIVLPVLLLVLLLSVILPLKIIL